MTDLSAVDYFSDPAVAQNPYEYYEYLRSQGPVFAEPHHGVVAVTGYREVMAAFKDTDSFSAINAIGGPFPPLPFEPDGDDITEQIEAHRHEFPIFEHMVVMDPPQHERARSLLSKLLTPRRLKEDADYMWRLADHQLDEFIADGRCQSCSRCCARRRSCSRPARRPSPKLLSAAVQTLGDHPEFQHRLRENPSDITAFIEEALRFQSPTKVDFRLARKTTALGGFRSRPGRW